jgi:hypothetical protein
MRFAMTAKTLVRERASEEGVIREITAKNVRKVTRFRQGGMEALEREVRRLEMRRNGEGEGGMRNVEGSGGSERIEGG